MIENIGTCETVWNSQLIIRSQITTIVHLSEGHTQSITYKVLRAQRNASKCLKRSSCLAKYSHTYSHTQVSAGRIGFCACVYKIFRVCAVALANVHSAKGVFT